MGICEIPINSEIGYDRDSDEEYEAPMVPVEVGVPGTGKELTCEGCGQE